MERFKIIDKELMHNIDEEWLCVQIKDYQEKISFWIDCSLMDGYGNRKEFKTEDLYIDWDFNQYIFFTDDEEDCRQQDYQENGDNIDALQEFIDEKNEELVAILRH